MANLVSNIDGVLEIWDDGTVNIVGGKLQIDSSDVLNNNNNALFSDVRVDTLDFGDSSPTLIDNGNFLYKLLVVTLILGLIILRTLIFILIEILFTLTKKYK